jgi:hypothetical protein
MFQIEADRGGTIDMPDLITLSEGQVQFLSDGAGSLVDLPLLNSVTARLRTVNFEARNSGRLNSP